MTVQTSRDSNLTLYRMGWFDIPPPTAAAGTATYATLDGSLALTSRVWWIVAGVTLSV
jgi:hypothetical protein